MEPAIYTAVASVLVALVGGWAAVRGHRETTRTQEAANELADRDQHFNQLRALNGELVAQLREERTRAERLERRIDVLEDDRDHLEDCVRAYRSALVDAGAPLPHLPPPPSKD